MLDGVDIEWKVSSRNYFINYGEVVIHYGVNRFDDVAVEESSSLLEVIIQLCSCKPSDLIG